MPLLESPDDVRGVMVVTAAYFVVYYAFMVQQMAGKKYINSDRPSEYQLYRMTDRTFLNTLEQMVSEPGGAIRLLLAGTIHAYSLAPRALCRRVGERGAGMDCRWCKAALSGMSTTLVRYALLLTTSCYSVPVCILFGAGRCRCSGRWTGSGTIKWNSLPNR